MNRSIVKYITVLGIMLLLFGCKKNSHDTIVHLGEESYKTPVDAIYPKNYRDLWRSLAQSCSDTIYNGIFPPDLYGLYEMEGTYSGGNEEIYQGNEYVSLVTSESMAYYGKKYLYLLVEEQVNGVAKLKFKTKYKTPLNPPYNYDDWNEVDSVYIWGDGDNGCFTMCFECGIKSGSKYYTNGFIVNGKKKIRDGVDTDTIYNMEFWSVIKERDPDSDQPGIMKVGGQCYYFSPMVVKKDNQ